MRDIVRLCAKLAALLLLLGLPYLYVLYQWTVQYDYDYCKATHAANSLVLGDSRTRRGISPEILRQELGLNGKMLNLAFNGVSSPYGEHYYRLIKKKIARGTTDGLFIVTVSPGSIMDYLGESPTMPREGDFRFYNLWFVNLNPNLEYLIRNVAGDRSLATELLNQKKRKRHQDIFHPDGWVERKPNDRRQFKRQLDELKVTQRMPRRSPAREEYLDKTVAHLKQYGQVVLVRLPIAEEMLAEETKVFPEFDGLIKGLAEKYGVPYHDFAGHGAEFEFYDDFHHLDGPSARAFSAALAEQIQAQRDK
jgi:hypothetical protein